MKTRYSKEQLEDPLIASSQAILKKCVHCGLCTATCSSYVILGDERASPRGRIYQINRMLEKGERPSATTVGFLDNCLTCLSCMTTCPSGVDYVHLIDMARARINKNARRPLFAKLARSVLAAVLPHPGRLKTAMRLGRLARPFATSFKHLGLTTISALLDALPARSSRAARYKMHTPAKGKRSRRVALLPGCTNDVLRPSINEAMIALLSRMGVEVIVPAGVGCCGAIEHQLGDEDKAIRAARRNIDVLTRLHDEQPLDGILTAASGCGSMLKDYAHLLRNDEGYAQRAGDIAALSLDVTEILHDIPLTAPRQWSDIKVAYHADCVLEHGQKVTEQPRTLLANAGYTVLEIPEGHLCCGSAGTYNLLQPVISTALRTRKLDNIARTEPDIIATGNIGCINHLAPHSDKPVIHTIELLNWAYGGECPREIRHLENHINRISGVLADSHMDDLEPVSPS